MSQLTYEQLRENEIIQITIDNIYRKVIELTIKLYANPSDQDIINYHFNTIEQLKSKLIN